MTYCSVVTVLALVGLAKKRFGHYAILENLSLRSQREKCNMQNLDVFIFWSKFKSFSS